MKAFALLSAGLAAMTVSLLSAKPAYAIPQTFVSGAGGGATCTRAAPCATFQAAHDATDPGGQISCLDSGNFGTGTTTITKSITIDCAGTAAMAFPTVVSQAFVINTAGVVVRLRNLTIQGIGLSTGIQFTNGAALFVENCVIDNFHSGPARGIFFAPSSGTAELFVSDSVISNNHNPAFGGAGVGIQISPTGSARAVIDRVRLQNNRTGIFASAPAGQTTIVQLRDSVVSGNVTNGIDASGPGFAAFVVERSSLMFNGSSGVFASSANAAVHIGSSTVIGNGGGLITASGGKIFSYQNNQATGNNADGAPTNVLTLK
jgi:parallel beta helix pectate lyase-like protein